MTNKPEETKTKTPGVGDVAIAAIISGSNNAEALAAVKAAFPKAKTSVASVNWYRNHLRSNGNPHGVKTSRELNKIAKDAATAAAKSDDGAKDAKGGAKDKKDPLS